MSADTVCVADPDTVLLFDQDTVYLDCPTSGAPAGGGGVVASVPAGGGVMADVTPAPRPI